jgi:Aerotolerance regulator N-terminal
MSSFFINPITMWVGAGLVATPIIIHLINRMRFRRVKWAAMEFLLKAQKKMRRKKILEQLLLLLLRCLLVFLAGLLFARFLGFDPLQGKETRPVMHIVILDDTPSMADPGETGAPGDAFTIAKKQITDKIMTAAAKATTPQRLRIIRLSDQVDVLNAGPDSDAEPEAINGDNVKAIEKVKGVLATECEKPANVHVSLAEGLKKAKDYFDKNPGPEVSKVVHVLSDMRAVDWTTDSEAIAQATKELTESGVKVHLVDVATPYRTKDRKTPAYSDNVGIVELKPRSRVVAKNVKDQDAEFEIRVRNFGNTDLKNVRVEFYLNGQGNSIATIEFETLPANQERMQVFRVNFNQTYVTTATKEDPLARFNVLSAILRNAGADALAFDNVRHAVVEVREKLAVLVILKPEDLANPNDKNGDSFYLHNLFENEENKLSGIEWVAATPDALVKRDLREFSSIYMLNIPSLTEPEANQLERYVREGGGVGIFLGDKVAPEAYNKLLYRGGDGFFPVPLPASFTEPLSEAEKEKRKFSFSKRVLIRDTAAKSHPALRGIYEDQTSGKDTAKDVEKSFTFAGIFQHWKIERIGKWRENQNIKELYCLPNETASGEFEARALKLIEAVRAKYGEPKFEKYRKDVDELLNKIRTDVGPDNFPLTELARHMDALLSDQVSVGDASEALLREFWAQPEMSEAKTLAQSLRDSSKYGDPLYFARRFGNGRVGVFTIPTGGSWTDWPSGGPGVAGWVAVMIELQKYLSGGGVEENRTLGSQVEASFEPGRYKPSANWTYMTYDVAKADKTTQKADLVREPLAKEEPKVFALDTKDGALRLNFPETKRPGVYVFTLTWQKRDGDPASAPSTKPEYLAVAINPDSEREGDLRRTNSDDFTTTAHGAELHTPAEDYERTFEQRPTDLSSGRWIYLVILLVLIFEQAMAVRLSYHRQPEDLAAFAPSAAAAMAGRTVAPPTESESESAGSEA